MGVLSLKYAQNIAEVYEVESEGTKTINVCDIGKGTLIERVLVYVKEPCTATGTVNLKVGDTADDDGFIVASSAKAVAGTIYGDDIDDWGAYLKAAVTCGATGASAEVGHGGKVFDADSKLTFVLSAAPSTNGKFLIAVFGKRFLL